MFINMACTVLGTVYTQRKLFRMLKSLKNRKGVKIVYSCHVSCRILGVLLSHPCIVEVGPKRPHFCTYKPPSERSGLLSSKFFFRQQDRHLESDIRALSILQHNPSRHDHLKAFLQIVANKIDISSLTFAVSSKCGPGQCWLAPP